MTGESQQGMGFRAQIRELLHNEPVSLVPVTERNLPKFTETLTQLSELSMADGMLPMTGNQQESPAEWRDSTRGLWLIGAKEADFSNPDNVAGFVNIYEPSQQDAINTWLTDKKMRVYDPGALVELSSFVKDVPGAADLEISGDKQALARVFMDEAYKGVRAVTVWETHSADNSLDPDAVAQMKKLGGWPLGSMRYDQAEAVDSTCFLITRRQFLDALTGAKRA